MNSSILCCASRKQKLNLAAGGTIGCRNIPQSWGNKRPLGMWDRLEMNCGEKERKENNTFVHKKRIKLAS